MALLFLVARKDMIAFAHTQTYKMLFVCYTRGFDKTNSRPGEGNERDTHKKRENIPFENCFN
jgi:hypothetical protein